MYLHGTNASSLIRHAKERIQNLTSESSFREKKKSIPISKIQHVCPNEKSVGSCGGLNKIRQFTENAKLQLAFWFRMFQ